MGKVILIILFLVIYIPLCLVLSAWAGATLWEWFVAPLFGLPLLNYAQALGLALVAKYFASHTPPYKEKELMVEKISAILVPLLNPLFVVGLGWVIKGFL